MFNLKQYNLKRYNFSLIIVVMILCIMSAYFVKFAGNIDGVGGSYFKRQLIGAIACLIIAIIISFIDYHYVCAFVGIYYVVGTILAAATRLSPLGTDLETDSYRWIRLPGVNFQPSEICKIIIILTLAVFFTKFNEDINKFRTIALAIIIMAVPTFFILIQSDLSSSVVIMFVFCVMIFAAGLSYKIVVPTLILSVPTVIALFWYIQQPFQKLLKDYQLKRVTGFLHPNEFLDSTNFQQYHSIHSIAAGQLYGKLIADNGVGTREYSWVDVRESDFIFSVIGEEVGFIGVCFVIGLLAIVIVKCIIVAKKANDYLGQLIAIGISAMFAFQTFANIGVAAFILPNTGLPLPFLSNGISSMLSCMIGIGIILNIGLQGSNSTRSSINYYDL